ncbi:MAG: hypothetical protein EP350_02820 [Alphaproteobacteria bacterium]|nr:MAG: hypothetical protein EP350_02820 [Alphaproteobacteria bacterium]
MILRRTRLTYAWLLIAAALFMRAAVPAGWMPEQGQGATIVAKVCNSAITIEIPLKRGETAPRQGNHQVPCAFSSFADGAPLAEPIGLAEAAIALQAITLAILEQFELGVQPRVKPPGRAPPVMG